MKRRIAIVVAIAALVAGVLYSRSLRSPEAGPAAPPVVAAPSPVPVDGGIPGATLLEGLGDYHFAVTSGNPQVARWFDQGLMLTYGFNHDAAERSFLRATQLDPACAMCWWGAALVLGPHVNSGMDPANNEKAWQRLQRAMALAPKATPRERAFIQALAARYDERPPQDRRILDEAWAQATGKLMAEFPDDLDAATFHAEAMMDTQPWDYYGPRNGWSLFGLAQALRAQSREAEATDVDNQFVAAWQHADIKLTASRF